MLADHRGQVRRDRAEREPGANPRGVSPTAGGSLGNPEAYGRHQPATWEAPLFPPPDHPVPERGLLGRFVFALVAAVVFLLVVDAQ